MSEKIIYKEDGYYEIQDTQDFEKRTPSQVIKDMAIQTSKMKFRTKLWMEKIPVFHPLIEEAILKNAIEDYKPMYDLIINESFDDNFKELLNVDKKRDQIKLLKGAAITIFGLFSFFHFANEDKGYLLSHYSSQHLPNDIVQSDMPPLAHSPNKNEINKIGNTNLSDKQIRHAIKFRSVIVSRFIDLGDKWHCFFLTYDSMSGEENWKNGTPHLHYISSAFGLSRNKVLTELKSKNYKLGNLPHIELK